MSSPQTGGRRRGFVSVWAGTFLSVEAAEVYFGIPDEIGVYLPPEAFARDFGLDELVAENLEVDFELLANRPVEQLLADATFASSFADQAVAAARRKGVDSAQGVALLYDFDYESVPDRQDAAGPLRFVGTFPFAGGSVTDPSEPMRDPRITVRDIVDDVL